MITEKNKMFLAKYGSPEHLHQLKDDKDFEVRSSIASNQNTSIDILHALKNDENAGVACGVVLNPNTPADILHHMKNYHWQFVRKIAREQLKNRFGIENDH